MQLLNWIMSWFALNCNNDWEHGRTISINLSEENKCWIVELNLNCTDLEDKEFNSINEKNSNTDWLYCSVEHGFFKGYGDFYKLSKILEIFKKWATPYLVERMLKYKCLIE